MVEGTECLGGAVLLGEEGVGGTGGTQSHWRPETHQGPMLGELRPGLEAEAGWLCSPGW